MTGSLEFPEISTRTLSAITPHETPVQTLAILAKILSENIFLIYVCTSSDKCVNGTSLFFHFRFQPCVCSK